MIVVLRFILVVLSTGKVLVSEVTTTDNIIATFTFAEGESSVSLFKGKVPSDGTPLKRINVQPLPLVVIYYLLAVAGIGFSVVCLCFNVIFRARK